jgi:hypothetical protein
MEKVCRTFNFFGSPGILTGSLQWTISNQPLAVSRQLMRDCSFVKPQFGKTYNNTP